MFRRDLRQPLTPDPTSPWMKYRLRKRNATNSGATIAEHAAIATPQFAVMFETICARPTGSVLFASDVMRIDAAVYPFQAIRNEKIATVISPGLDSGEDHAHECTEPRAAVDHRRLLQFEGHGPEEAPQHPDRERHRDREFGDYQG
jgi:hypothetical protein